MSSDKNKQRQRVIPWLTRMIERGGEMLVNSKWVPQIHDDDDFNFMVEHGLVERVRRGGPLGKNRRTYYRIIDQAKVDKYIKGE